MVGVFEQFCTFMGMRTCQVTRLAVLPYCLKARVKAFKVVGVFEQFCTFMGMRTCQVTRLAVLPYCLKSRVKAF